MYYCTHTIAFVTIYLSKNIMSAIILVLSESGIAIRSSELPSVLFLELCITPEQRTVSPQHVVPVTSVSAVHLVTNRQM